MKEGLRGKSLHFDVPIHRARFRRLGQWASGEGGSLGSLIRGVGQRINGIGPTAYLEQGRVFDVEESQSEETLSCHGDTEFAETACARFSANSAA